MAPRSPGTFVDRVLLGRCRMRELVIGHDHGFGRGRSGDVATLRRLGQRPRIPVDVVDAGGGGRHAGVEHRDPAGDRWRRPGRRRRGCWGGPTRSAAGWCRASSGDAHRLSDAQPRRRRRGKLLPPDGVYAVRVETPAGRFGGMMNQGPRPTFGDGRPAGSRSTCSGSTGDLYDRWVRIDGSHRLARDPAVRWRWRQLRQQLEDDRQPRARRSGRARARTLTRRSGARVTMFATIRNRMIVIGLLVVGSIYYLFPRNQRSRAWRRRPSCTRTVAGFR